MNLQNDPNDFALMKFGMALPKLQRIYKAAADKAVAPAGVSQTLAFNPVPQMFKPMLDIYANVDSFTGRPIESVHDEKLPKSERMGPRTSELARLLGSAGNMTNSTLPTASVTARQRCACGSSSSPRRSSSLNCGCSPAAS